jgi:hypothetical protein
MGRAGMSDRSMGDLLDFLPRIAETAEVFACVRVASEDFAQSARRSPTELVGHIRCTMKDGAILLNAFKGHVMSYSST